MRIFSIDRQGLNNYNLREYGYERKENDFGGRQCLHLLHYEK